MLDTVRHLLAFPLLMIATIAIVGNAIIPLRFMWTRKHDSLVFLVGGVLGCVGCPVSPNPVIQRYWWVPPLIDYGCVPSILIYAVYVSSLWTRAR